MTITVENLKRSFKEGYYAFKESRIESDLVHDLFHNRQYTQQQLNILANRGQPAETFNVIKLFARQMIGFYSTKLNTNKVEPRHPEHQIGASVINDVLDYIDDDTNFLTESDAIKLDGLLSGLFIAYVNVEDTGERDEFGRPLYRVTKEHVPSREIVLDPQSTRPDYKDARYIHRFKWVTGEVLDTMTSKYKVDKLNANTNFLDIPEAEQDYNYVNGYNGEYRYKDNYLIVHSIVMDNKGDTYSIIWSGDNIISKKKITYKNVKFPYRVVKLQDSDKIEYYGAFREVIESQMAINQALLQIQLSVNSDKVFVQDGAVGSIEEFKTAYARVSAVIPVLNISGIKIDKLSADIQQQYIVIDKAFDRIQRILGINDSFLGMAYASDSGRKVKLQQNATIMALRYIDNKLDMFYTALGRDVLALVKQYYRATQYIRVTDKVNGDRWVQINQPLINPETGQFYYDVEVDPETGELATDDAGNLLLTPLHHPDSDIETIDVTLKIISSSYNDADEKNQIMLETAINGNIGQALMTVNPAGYFKIGSLVLRNMKTKESPEIAKILEETSMMLSPQPQYQDQLGMAGSGGQLGGQGANSQMAKLPTSKEN